jgi:ribosomal protein L3 glutamine methyltransferase
MKNTSTVADCIEAVATTLASAGLHFGHGTDNARDEAAWLVLHVLGEPLDGSFCDWGQAVAEPQSQAIRQLAAERCASRKPLAYLTGTAFFAGLEFAVNEQVLVPRSPIAELILDGYRPWVEPERVGWILDMCTGSGCIAVASAVRLPGAQVDAADISPAALKVAALNVERHGLAGRVALFQSDLFEALPARRYDLIVANPPYVSSASMRSLPGEYLSEPGLGLESGPDGLDATLKILLDAPRFLGKDGVLICEVGESEDRLAQVLPEVPLLWLEFERGGSGVFVLSRQQLEEAGAVIATAMEIRDNEKHVT